MNQTDDPLDKLLKRARVPERSDGYWEQFPKRVICHISQRANQLERVGHNSLFRSWWLAPAAACLVFALGVVLWMMSPSPGDREAGKLARSEKLYREIAALFPGRVQAVVMDEQSVKLILSDKADVPPSTPLLLNICRQKQCRSIITFSGQQIEVNGQTLEVLLDGKGHVVVAGRDVVWSSAVPGQRAGSYRIQAQTLGSRS